MIATGIANTRWEEQCTQKVNDATTTLEGRVRNLWYWSEVSLKNPDMRKEQLEQFFRYGELPADIDKINEVEQVRLNQ